MNRVLLIEGDRFFSTLVCEQFAIDGHVVEHVHNGVEGLIALERGGWNCVLVDTHLADMDGLDICRRARALAGYVPVIVMSDHTSEAHRVLGLELGADDFVSKPIGVLELSARVRALLRRCAFLERHFHLRFSTIEIDDLSIDPVKRQAMLQDRRLDLTPREFDLLLFFMRHPGSVFSRLDLLAQVWGRAHSGYEHTVNVHINRLRGKIEWSPLEPRRLVTVWGRGYRFNENVASMSGLARRSLLDA